MTNKRRKIAASKSSSEVGSLARALLFSVPLSLVLWIVLLLLASSFAVGRDDPDALIVPLSLGITAMSSFAGGIISGKMRKGQGLASGLLTGVCFAAAMLIISLTGAYQDFGADFLYRTLLLCVILVSAVLGGVIATRKKKITHIRH